MFRVKFVLAFAFIFLVTSSSANQVTFYHTIRFIFLVFCMFHVYESCARLLYKAYANFANNLHDMRTKINSVYTSMLHNSPISIF